MSIFRTDGIAVTTEPNDPTIAVAVKLLRTSAHLSMAALAARCPVSKPYVQRIENGQNNPSYEVVDALDQALGAGGLLLALAHEQDSMRRRSLFAAIVAIAAGGGEYIRLLEGIAAAPPRRVGWSDVEAVAQAVNFATSVDLRYGGQAALGPSSSVLAWSVRLLDCSMTDPVKVRLSSQVAALADRVAWSHYDAGQDSHGTFGLALKAARGGSDPNLTAHILLDDSTALAHGDKDLGGAADLLFTEIDKPDLAPTVRANVCLTYARHIACMGRSREALDLVNRAFDISAAETRAVPEWSKGFLANPAHLSSVAARTYLFAGDYDHAISGFRTALDGLGTDRKRGRAYALCLLSLSYLRGGYDDCALTTVSELLADPPKDERRMQSIRVAGHARTVAKELALAGHPDEAARVAEFAKAVKPAA